MKDLALLHATVTAIAPTPGRSTLSRLAAQPADSLLALIGAYRADERGEKIDVGIGVYRDEQGQTPVLAAVKEAERRLHEEQTTKGYLGPEGDARFFELLVSLALEDGFGDRVGGFQTPGGTGALRLGAELIATASPGVTIYVGTPTWANHAPILQAAGLDLRPYPFFDVDRQAIHFDRMLGVFEMAERGDVVLLHGCCHNPLGADLDQDEWLAIAEVVGRRGLLPFIDLAYHGLGDGLDADVQGVRAVLASAEEALVAYSCDKNFGLYRERTGALFALTADVKQAAVVQSNLLSLARANWSMPPDHGAALVRLVLDDPDLRASWKTELEDMRTRILSVRRQLAALDPWFAPVGRQKGMFSTLPLDAGQVRTLREKHGIYMAPTGRISLAGLTGKTVPAFVAAIAAVR